MEKEQLIRIFKNISHTIDCSGEGETLTYVMPELNDDEHEFRAEFVDAVETIFKEMINKR